MPAPGDIERVGPGFFINLADLCYLGIVKTAGNKVAAGHPHQDDEIGPDRLPDGFHHFPREAGPVFKTAAVLIGPLVGYRGEELVDQVTGRGADLHPVKAGLPGPDSSLGESFLYFLNIVFSHLPRGLHSKNGCRDGRGSNRLKPSRGHGEIVTAGVIELGRDGGAFLADGGSQVFQTGDVFVIIQTNH